MDDLEQTRIMTSADRDQAGPGPLHCLELIEGFDVGRRYMVGSAGATIGRTAPADIVLADSQVSRAHCRLSVEGEALMVADLGSTNGTFVNESRLLEPAALEVGAVLTVGSQSLRVTDPLAPQHGLGGLLRHVRDPATGAAEPAGPPPDIFLSYNRGDQAAAKLYADAFVAAGLTVWWDVTLRAGEAYDEVTEGALRSAKAVVVLWSKRSVASRWVRAEATLGDRNGTLIPAMIEACERPVMFELTQTADLSHWQGEVDDRAWLAFLSDVQRLVVRGRPAKPDAKTTGHDNG